MAPLAATTGEARRHTHRPRRPAPARIWNAAAPRRWKSELPGEPPGRLRIWPPGVQPSPAPENLRLPAVGRPPKEQLGGLFSHARPCSLRPRPQPARRSGKPPGLSAALRLRHPQSPVRPGRAPRRWTAAGQRDLQQQAIHRWEQSWPGASSTSRPLFHISRPWPTAPTRAPVAPVPFWENDPVRFGAGFARALTACRSWMRRCVSSNASGWMPQPLPHDRPPPFWSRSDQSTGRWGERWPLHGAACGLRSGAPNNGGWQWKRQQRHGPRTQNR